MQFEIIYKAVGLVCNKIYIIGIGYDSQQLQVECFDLSTQVWRAALLVLTQNYKDWHAIENACIDKNTVAEL